MNILFFIFFIYLYTTIILSPLVLNMKIKLLVYFVFGCFTIIVGQNPAIKLVVDNYYQQAEEISKTNQDEALSITQMGIDLANQNKYKEGLGNGYNLKAR